MDYEPTLPASRTTTSGLNHAATLNKAKDLGAGQPRCGAIGKSARKSTCKLSLWEPCTGISLDIGIFGKAPRRTSLVKRCMESLIAMWIAEIVHRYDLLRSHNRANLTLPAGRHPADQRSSPYVN